MPHTAMALLLTMVICAGAASAQGAAKPRDLQHDAAMARELARLDLGRVKPGGAENWAVAEVDPDPESGGGYVLGGHIDVTTGKFVGGRLVGRLLGTVRVVQPLAGKLEKSYVYRWDGPGPSSGNSLLPPEQMYLLFRFGGVVICKVDTTLKGEAAFSPHYRIPGDWARWALPAITYIQAHPDLFAAGQHREDQSTLQELAGGDNPFLTLAVFRILVHTDEQPDALERIVVGKTDFLQAALLAILIETQRDTGIAQHEQRADLVKALPLITAFLDRSTPAQALATLLGLWAAGNESIDSPGDPWRQEISRHILKRMPAWPAEDPVAKLIEQQHSYLGF